MPAYHPRLPEGGRVQRASLLVWAVAPVALLAACGGGGSSGGVNSTPNPGGNPTPTPTPTATATPAAQFDTAEYRRSDGPEQHKAVSAWSKGYTGDDVSIAVIDSGIDVDNAEFAGRISPASKDIFDSRNQLDASDSHGTNVALVAAAARNSSGILGMAWGPMCWRSAPIHREAARRTIPPAWTIASSPTVPSPTRSTMPWPVAQR